MGNLTEDFYNWATDNPEFGVPATGSLGCHLGGMVAGFICGALFLRDINQTHLEHLVKFVMKVVFVIATIGFVLHDINWCEATKNICGSNVSDEPLVNTGSKDGYCTTAEKATCLWCTEDP